MKGECTDAIPAQLIGDMVGGVLRSDKNEDTLPFFVGEKMAQQRGPLFRIDADGPLGNDRGLGERRFEMEARRFVENLPGQMLERGRASG